MGEEGGGGRGGGIEQKTFSAPRCNNTSLREIRPLIINLKVSEVGPLMFSNVKSRLPLQDLSRLYRSPCVKVTFSARKVLYESIKDRQQLIWPILVLSQYIEDLYGPPKTLCTYYILL